MEHAKPLESKKRRRASTCCYFRELLNEIPSEVIPISLARSNHVPSTSDRPTIEALVSTSDTSIRTLKAALINIRSVYEDLYVRLENIREYNDVQRSLLSPIRRLPDELLANIFAYVYGGKISILTKSHGQIWDLQQVCIRWRNLAQSTPLLWNNFEVGIRRIDDPAIMERRIRACLKFSNPAPLSMVLLPTNIYMFFSALGSIADQAHRWRSLTVDGRTIQPVVTMGIVMTFIERRGLSQLRTLVLSNGRNKGAFHDVFQSATALEEVTLSNSNLPEASFFPWTNVKRLTVEHCQNDSFDEEFEIGTIFCAMTSLEELSWRFNERKLISTPPVISLPSLHSLSIEDSEELHAILHKFRVPSLSTLRIVENVEDIAPLLSMVRLSSCAITQLQLSLCPSDMLQILKELPTVEALSLLRRGISQEFIGRLVWASRPDSESNNVLPSLKKLELLAMNHYMEEVPMDCLCCLSYIMTSRSASEARQQTSLSTPLTLVKCSMYVPEGQHEKYEEMFDCLRNVGAEARVEVELEIGKREYEESKSEGSSSSSLSIRSW